LHEFLSRTAKFWYQNDEESLRSKMYETDLLESRSEMDGEEVKFHGYANIYPLAIMENAKK